LLGVSWGPEKLEENWQRYTPEAKNLRQNIGKFENLMSETKLGNLFKKITENV
jgi:hypothetical protein